MHDCEPISRWRPAGGGVYRRPRSLSCIMAEENTEGISWDYGSQTVSVSNAWLKVVWEESSQAEKPWHLDTVQEKLLVPAARETAYS